MDASSPLDLERLFHEHQRDLLAMLRRMVRCQHTAADLAQEAYVRLLRLTEDQLVIHPRAFLYRTATNLALDHLRKEKIRAPSSTPLDDAIEMPTGAPSLVKVLEDRERFSVFQGALRSLPFPSVEVLVLRRIHGLSHDEIGRRLRLTKREVENHLAKALYHCQKALLKYSQA